MSCYPAPHPPTRLPLNLLRLMSMIFQKWPKIVVDLLSVTYQARLVIGMPPLHGGDQLEQLRLLHFPTAARVVDLQAWKIKLSKN